MGSGATVVMAPAGSPDADGAGGVGRWRKEWWPYGHAREVGSLAMKTSRVTIDAGTATRLEALASDGTPTNGRDRPDAVLRDVRPLPAAARPALGDPVAGAAGSVQPMTPAELDAAYRGQLVGSLMTGHVEKRQIMAMLHRMDSSKGRRLSAEQAAESWVWSDLHLNHGAIISAGGRPFGDTTTMRGALLAAW